MTFNGDTVIGKPTLAMIEIFIAEKGLFCEAQEAYDYWEKKQWINQKGKQVATLESAICSFNGIMVNRAVKKSAKALGITKLGIKARKKEKKILRRQLLAGDENAKELIKQATENKIKTVIVKKEKQEKPIYEKQLKDKRWYSFRRFVFDVRGCACEKCGATTNLQVHHPKYKKGRMAWEYTCNEVEVLCRDCHKKVHGIK